MKMTSGIVLVVLALSPSLAVDKLKPEELIAKHLDSLGTPEARARVESFIANGTVTMGGVVGAGAGELTGKVTILSTGGKMRVGMEFPSKSFPGDHYAFDGKDVTVSTIQAGTRSFVGAFLYQNPNLISEGLLSGALTTNWALLHVNTRKPRLSYAGIKKVKEVPLHALKYRPRKGADDLEITLYFDSENFRHMRSELRYEARNNIGDPARSAGQSDNVLVISEDFEKFEKVEGLTLPTIYRIEANLTGARTLVYRWVLVLNEFFLNKPMEPAYFKVN